MNKDLNRSCFGKSRFERESYQNVLKTQKHRSRSALSRKEKRYCKVWQFFPESRLAQKLILTLLCVIGAAPFVLAGIFHLPASTGLILVILVFVFLVGPMVLLSFNARQKFKKRQDLNIEIFIKNSSSLENYDKEAINMVRDTLGELHELKPNKLLPEDKLRFLCLASKVPVPLQFEVVLGVANKMGMTLSESQVDHIGEKIYNEVDSVEYLTILLLEEFGKIRTL